MAVLIDMQFDKASLDQVKAELKKMFKKLSKPNPTKAVQNVAQVWALSYREEGSGVGGWVGLAERTIEERQLQGFGDGPILIRGGALFSMSSLFFMRGRKGRASASTNYGKRYVRTTASLDIHDGVATMSMGGPKTIHQKGMRSKNLPARPFWFTDATTLRAARTGVIQWIIDEVTK